MAEHLDLVINERGAASASRSVSRLGKETEKTGKSAKKAEKNTSLWSRSLGVLHSRALLVTVAILAMGAAAAIATPAVALLTGALISLVGIGTGGLLLLAGVMANFKKQMDVAGTAAYRLKNIANGFMAVFRDATKIGADKIFNAISKAMLILEPVLQAMTPLFTAMGQVAGKAIVTLAKGLKQLAPEFQSMLFAAMPVVTLLMQSFVPLMGTLLDVAEASMPVLQQLIQWFVDFTKWLRPAIQTVIAWTQSVKGQRTLQTYFRDIGVVAKYLWGVIKDLAVIVYQLYNQNKTLINAAVIAFFTALAGAIHWVAQNINWLAPLLGPLIASLAAGFAMWKAWLVIERVAGMLRAFMGLMKLMQGLMIAYRAGALGMTVATLGFEASLAAVAATVGIVIVALVAIGVAVFVLYKKWGWFHRAVDNTWDALKAFVAWLPGAFNAAVNGVKSAINWLVDKLQWIIDKGKKVFGIAKNIAKWTPGGIAARGVNKLAGAVGLPHFAQGGTMQRSGPAVVGERGPERVWLPQGAQVESNRPQQIQATIHVTNVLDGRVLAKSVHRQAVMAKSVR